MRILYKPNLFTREWPIVAILIIGLLLRLKGLAFQDLWLDELHTMNEAAPYVTWNQLFHSLKCCDQHPPLYFILEKISFGIFGHTAYTARMLSVIAGTAGIWAMYYFGKEVLNRRLGLIAAVLTCVNYYSITYSQEARPYIFAFLFAVLSYTWFIKLIKSPSRKNALLYSLFPLLLLYSHYYSLFVMASQVLLALLFLFQENSNQRATYFKNFLLAGVLITIGYAPWLSHLAAMSRIESFWIQGVPTDFIQQFFYGYFGNSPLLNPLIIGLLIIFIVHVSIHRSTANKIIENPLLLSFTVALSWIFATLLIPYIRSLMTVPMLFPRYTIVVLPAILLVLAYGIILFHKPLLQFLVTGLFVLISAIHLLLVLHYYTTTTKTQFDQMTKFVVTENKSGFPIINEKTHWHQQYYLKKYGSSSEVLVGKKDDLIDSILSRKSPKYTVDGFWIVGAHSDPKPAEGKLAQLDSAFLRLKSKDFHDAWAMLYVAKKDSNNIVIRNTDFVDGDIFADQYRAIWNGSITTRPIPVSKGKYRITLDAKGDKGGGEYPHVNIYIDGKLVKEFVLMDEKETSFETEIDSDLPKIKIEMTNDFSEPGKGDRNVFVKSVILERL